MQPTSEISERLAVISAELAHIAKLLTNTQEKPVFPESARAKVEAGICLHPGCDVHKTQKQFRRGNCPTHYNKAKKLIDRKPMAEFGLIEKGLWLPLDDNPNPTEFDALVTELDQQESGLLAAAKKAAAKPARKKQGRTKSN